MPEKTESSTNVIEATQFKQQIENKTLPQIVHWRHEDKNVFIIFTFLFSEFSNRIPLKSLRLPVSALKNLKSFSCILV